MFLEAINISCNHLLVVSFSILYVIATDDNSLQFGRAHKCSASTKVVHGLCLMMAQVGNSDWQNNTTNNFVTYKT